MRSLKAVRDTLVVDYSSPSVNSMSPIPNRAVMTVSPFLLVVLVSYFKRSLWLCSQLWPNVGIGALGRTLYFACNAMCDAAEISARVLSTCAQNVIVSFLLIHIIWSRKIYVAIDHSLLIPSVSCFTTSSYLWNHMRTANNVSHAAYLQWNGCWCVSYLYKMRDGIQVTQVARHCVGPQG
jgi:hypothetical protein